MEIIWSYEAERSFNAILVYLLENWTKKEARAFTVLVESILDKITEHPELFEASRYNPNCRAAVITKHTTLYYRNSGNRIELITFWGNFQDPAKIIYLLDSK
jgi:plasmid stabilization system protein ParE